MSLLINEKNHNLLQKLTPYSCVDWTRFAINADKMTGKRGFKDHRIGEWFTSWHYKNIVNNNPEYSGKIAIPEMVNIKQLLKEHIIGLAQEIDEYILVLSKMEQEVDYVQKGDE